MPATRKRSRAPKSSPLTSQDNAYERFLALHARTDAFVMPNAWDGASAALLKREGFEALGSTSAGIAFSLGRQDGVHAVSRYQAIENACILSKASGLPINADLEDGFGPDPDDCVATVCEAIEAELAGVGIEDTTANPERPLHLFDHAVARIRAAAGAARGRIVLTARTDNFLQGNPDLDDTVRRLVAFAEAGADVLYAPGLPDMEAIRAVVLAVAPKPVNVLIGPAAKTVTLQELSAAGVRRVSVGGALYRVAMRALADSATGLRAGDMAAASGGIPFAEISAFFPP
ncbi:MAG: isocitrate lyase/phosphoenolpyruvate mutase family protein [Candidatus Eremiobacteraeota bacterium]|nr:isocitrate lyase/phosphoenolpyruvate mutase family protein [Candidatus Eremiobacteraeota bacterium]